MSDLLSEYPMAIVGLVFLIGGGLAAALYAYERAECTGTWHEGVVAGQFSYWCETPEGDR